MMSSNTTDIGKSDVGALRPALPGVLTVVAVAPYFLGVVNVWVGARYKRREVTGVAELLELAPPYADISITEMLK